MKALAAVLLALALACVLRAIAAIIAGSFQQGMLLFLAAALFSGGGGWFWENGRK